MRIKKKVNGEVKITLEQQWEINLFAGLVGGTSDDVAEKFGMPEQKYACNGNVIYDAYEFLRRISDEKYVHLKIETER